MKKVFLIIQREYWTRVRKKSFIITTLLAPLGFAAFFVVMILLAQNSESEKRIAVIDESGIFKNNISDTRNLHFKFVDDELAALELTYRAQQFDGILYIPQLKNLSSPRGIQYRSEDHLGISSLAHVQEELSDAIIKRKIEAASLDPKMLEDLQEVDMQLETITLGEEGEKTVDSKIAMGLGYIMGFAIYMILLVYGTMVMKGVVEEKSNKIVEVIVSSVKPFQLMLGKIIGVGAVGLTQFVLWGILIVVIQFVLAFAFSDQLQQLAEFQASQGQAMSAGQSPEEMQVFIADLIEGTKNINFTAIFFQFLFFFFGGYMLYGALFAAIGAAAGEEGEGQSLNFIVSIPIIISIVIMTAVVQEPNSTLAVWSSIFPFTSPVVMPSRLAYEPPIWQIITSMLCLVGGFLFTTWLAGRIYRVGILMSGKKVSFKDLAMWVKG